MINIKSVSEYLDSIAPYKTQCDWDNCGLLVGNAENVVEKIGICLDLTRETLEDAIKNGCNLIITHHPVIFSPKKTFLSGDLVYEAAVRNISIISAHTCFDCAENGVNDFLCEALEIKNAVGVENDECVVPMARIGDVEEISPVELAKKISRALSATVQLVDCEKPIKKLAVCGGSAMSFFEDVVAAGADAYLTGEFKHHMLLEAKERGVTVFVAGHFETENPSLINIKKSLESKFEGVEAILLKQSPPVIFVKEEE